MFEVNHNTRTLLQLWKGDEGWDLYKNPGNSEETVLAPDRLANFETFWKIPAFACMVMRGWNTHWPLAVFLFQTNLMVNPVLLGWTPDEIHESVMRIRVNTAPVLWAPHISSHSNNLCCVQCCVSMFRDSVLGTCNTFKSPYFHSLEDWRNTENPGQFTFNNEIGTFRSQRAVKIWDFHNTRYQHFMHTAISPSKPACKHIPKEKLMDFKIPCPY